MADPFGIIGLVTVVDKVLRAAVELWKGWKDAPETARNFVGDLEALKTVLSETSVNILLHPDFKDAFHRRPSTLLTHPASEDDADATTNIMLSCQGELEGMPRALEGSGKGGRLAGWDRLRSVFSAKSTGDKVKSLQQRFRVLNGMIAVDYPGSVHLHLPRSQGGESGTGGVASGPSGGPLCCEIWR